MERLTFEGNFCDIAQCEATPGGSYCENGSCAQREVWERLKAYEDAGISPAACEQAKKIEEGLNADNYSIARMVELMNADKDGRVVVRCKDCVHYRKYMGRDKCAKNATVLDGREVGFHATGKDEFCSYGKYQTNTGGKQ